MSQQEELGFVKSTGDFREKLYTIGRRGERRWVYNSIARGFFYRWRQLAACLLMIIYLAVPWIEIGGQQAVRLDIPGRRFILLGHTFWATDTFLLVLAFGFLAVCLFFFTALLGRVWCGWACPETVFLEFLFRPFERLIEGGPAQRQRLDQDPWNGRKILKKGLKYFIFLLLSWLIATCGLAYFVGTQPLLEMIGGWPQEHPAPFVFTLIVTGFCLFQFGWFREQFCTVLCPYARFQSVLLDTNSIVVGYDTRRGEPRHKLTRAGGREHNAGDCIDCGLCVRVCPTGIDIRNGLQLECISCTQCIDACDSVMTRIGRPLGLIRYDTENGLERKRTRILRPRIAFYGAVLTAYILGASYWFSHRELTEAQVLRNSGGTPYRLLDHFTVSNHLNVRISNKSGREMRYFIKVPGAGDVALITPLNPVSVGAGKIVTAPVFVNFPLRGLSEGQRSIELEITTPDGYRRTLPVVLIGPEDAKSGFNENHG